MKTKNGLYALVNSRRKPFGFYSTQPYFMERVRGRKWFFYNVRRTARGYQFVNRAFSPDWSVKGDGGADDAVKRGRWVFVCPTPRAK